jgi:thymidylate kinase
MVTTIHIEGVDRTGKDTIAAELTKQSNLKYFITSRSPISTYAYGLIYDRDTMSIEELAKYFKNSEIVLVYLKPDKETLKQRCLATNHPPVNDIDIDVFNKVVEKLSPTTRVVMIDNINDTPQQIVAKILSEVEKWKTN